MSAPWWSMRPNKFVDRRLFAELLGKVNDIRSLSDHAYVSMGGPFLDDFTVVQSAVNFRSLLSIEKSAITGARATFNRPYERIVCRIEDSSSFVVRLSEYRAELNASKFVVWLDFMGSKRKEQSDQLADLVRSVAGGDICRITMNAQVGPPNAGETADDRQARVLRELADDLGDLLPGDVDADDMTPTGLPAVLFKCIRNAAERAAEVSGKVVRPLLLVRYSDGAQMITATFLVDQSTDSDITTDDHLKSWKFMATGDWGNVQTLAVRPLSGREIRRIEYFVHNKPSQIKIELPFVPEQDVSQYIKFRPYFPKFRHVP
jgi:putative O-methyltransferase